MGTVLRFPRRRRHGRASAVAKPNSAGSGCFPIFAKAADKLRNCSAGMRPDAFQLLTADLPTPAAAAVATPPPNASISSSTDVTILPNSSSTMNLSRVHERTVEMWYAEMFDFGMPEIRKKDVAGRLEILRASQGLTQEEIAKEIGYEDAPGWANLIAARQKTNIDVIQANRLCDKYGASLDWIYRGIESGLTVSCRAAIDAVLARKAEGEKLRDIGRSIKKQREAALAAAEMRRMRNA